MAISPKKTPKLVRGFRQLTFNPAPRLRSLRARLGESNPVQEAWAQAAQALADAVAEFDRSRHLETPSKRYSAVVAEERFWTAAELEKLTPNERAAIIDERMVTDLSQLDPDLVERARAKGRELLEARGVLGNQA